MKLLMIINGMDIGGAEISLESLSYALDPSIDVKIISLSGSGKIAYKMKKKGYEIHELNFKKKLLPFSEIFKLFSLIKKINPDVVHTWMYHSNFIGGLVAKTLGIKRIIWSVHAFNIQQGMLKFKTRLLVRMLAIFSYFIPNQIICCSQSTLNVHKKLLYSQEKLIFIPNGIEPKNFFYSRDYRISIRSELGLKDEDILVGCIGRYDVQKNQIGFLDIVSKIVSKHSNYHFIFVGRDNDVHNSDLALALKTLNLNQRLHLLGERDDVNEILSAIDIFALPSKGEAFPISLCEAMLCEVPCAASNVGDVSYIMGNLIEAIDIENFELFYERIIDLGKKSHYERRQLGRQLKQRVLDKFSIEKIAKYHEELYEV